MSLKDKPYNLYESKSARKRGWLRILVGALVVLVFMGVAVTGGGYLWLNHLMDQMPEDPNQEEIEAAISETTVQQEGDTSEDNPKALNILVLGSDSRDPEGEYYGRSDTLMVVHVDPEEDFVSVLSIPRDLRVDVPGYGKQKINAAFAQGGPALTVRTVQRNMAIDLDHYVHVDFEGFKDITKALGGIYVDVDRRYYYAGNAYERIDIRPGYQALSGENALDYVRFRHDQNADFGRMERQQLFLRAAREQALRWSKAHKVPKLMDILVKHMSTDIGLTEALKYAYWGVRLGSGRIKQVKIDAYTAEIGDASYVLTREGAVSAAIKEMATPPEEQVASTGSEDRTVASTSTTEPQVQAEADLEGVTVDVLNGNGRAGEASSAAEWLEDMGATIGEVGDARSFATVTTFVDYPPGDKTAAELVGRAVGVDELQEDAGREQVTLVLGQDAEIPEEFRVEPAISSLPHSELWQSLVNDVSFTLMAPSFLPEGYIYEDHRVYDIQTPSGQEPALKMVYQLGGRDQYLGIMQTTFIEAPLAADGEMVTRGGNIYNVVGAEDGVDHVWWEQDGVLYWISNTLSHLLSREEMLELAASTMVVE